MANIKFELNKKGVEELLKSEAMMAICEEHANATAQAAGEGYEVSTYVGKTRVNASVKAVTHKAKKDNYENNTLLKALQ